MNTSDNVKRVVVGGLILMIFVLAFLMLRPIIIPIIFGLLAAYIFSPVYKKVYKKTKKKNFSAFLMILCFAVLLVVPLIYIIPGLVNQIFEVFVKFQSLNIYDIVTGLVEGDTGASIAANIDNIISQGFSILLNQFKNLIMNIPSLILKFSVFLFTFFFAVRDTESLKQYVSSLSPFSKNLERKLMNEFRGITNAIVFGQVLIGIIQGLALGIGLFFLGVPNVLVLTFIACVVCIIPLVGSWTVWLPTSVFLFMNDKIFSSIFLFLYGMLFVGTIDNFLRPYILSKQSNLPVAISIIGTIGGLYFFGIAGILLGPLILAYVIIIIEFYQQGKLKELFRK